MMLGELTQWVRETPPNEVWRETVAAWKHGVAVFVTLTLAAGAAMFVAAVIWFALNAVPLLLVDGWTFERSLDAFGWTALFWLPVAYSLGARNLPSTPQEVSVVS